MSFLFGNVTRDAVSEVSDRAGTQRVAFEERINYSDFQFRPGLAYQLKLKDKLYLNAGATYTIGTNVTARRLSTIQQRTVTQTNADPQIIFRDTLESQQRGSVFLPAETQAGLSLEKINQWMVGVDFSTQSWANYRSFGVGENLGTAYRLSLGGEITPNLFSINNYLKRASYRLGVSYAELPVRIGNRQLDDVSLSLGASFPLGRGLSAINLAVVAGQRGRFSQSSIKEQYIKVLVGFTLRDAQWFIKRKLD